VPGLLERYGLPADDIERRSLAMVEAAIPACSGWTTEAREIVKRMVYAAGDLALAGMARVHPDAVQAGLQALDAQAPIVCDTRMVAAGLRKVSNPLHIAVDSALGAGSAPGSRHSAPAATRAAEGIQGLRRELDGSIVLIGNAPTALLALLDLIDAGQAQPAVVVATPVGFVAAAESKAELMRRHAPYVTVEGTRGGSALAAAAFNALALLHDR
jgi:precorrin-8X/cobalt-precorrin-8 methylmutase